MNFARWLLCTSASRTLDRILLGFGFFVFALAQGLSAQSEEWHKDLGIRWSASSAVPPLTITGTVIDVLSGEPLERAQVYLEDLNIGAIADAEGRFEFEAPGAGQYVLRSQLLAYDLVLDTIRLDERSGLLTEIGLVERGMTPQELRPALQRLSLPCGTAVVSEAISNHEYQLTRGGSLIRLPDFDSTSVSGVIRDPSLCRDILSALPDDLQADLLAERREFHIQQFGETFVVGVCPWPIPRLQLDDGCSGHPVRREGDDFIRTNVTHVFW